MSMWTTINDRGFWQAWRTAEQRFKGAPQDLTGTDIATLRFLDEDLGEAAVQAMLRATPEPEPAPTPPSQTTAAPLARPASRSLTMRDVDAMATGVVRTIKAALTPVDARLAALEQRIAELEAKPSVSYKGVWNDQTTYFEGHAVASAGSLWICREIEVCGRKSGVNFTAWQLAVKRGKDGRGDAG